jgi:hypothetical protein
MVVCTTAACCARAAAWQDRMRPNMLRFVGAVSQAHVFDVCVYKLYPDAHEVPVWTWLLLQEDTTTYTFAVLCWASTWC